MYIKQQKFSDEETLYEVLYDFEIGTPYTYVTNLHAEINQILQNNKEIQEYISSIDAEEADVFIDDWKRSQVAKVLLANFDTFIVTKNTFSGINGNSETQFYIIDLF
ncbi:hypothetical protein CAP35_09195 [Chitinophagaceae bacterium IBVUCB1]|nr:hypothetical protein CAP35_09195 [Chitinophagaceae bacterium IBVUCB1]